CLQGYSSPLTF
nr:immunoglobulin light chain junction region [Macaca mulatta]MOY11767.1 immunoglobulin light chain junction region [Macaca mulatta]MOY11777.1 immunoglobulin light chain junction region [Macaca mulatta]